MNNKKTMALLKDTKLKFIITEDTLNDYYKILDCGYIETLNININNQEYVLIFDEIGKLKEHYINLMFIDKNYKQLDYVANHMIIQKYDYEKQEVISLSDKDIIHLSKWFEECTKLIDFENCRYIPTIKI